ncbi:hypothetical protein [Natrinema salaciae]|uniref:Uncharacterized protein n=1 Tax=Natrinema salaciae TaxID=1186196 RepID=A0A1H9RPS1_9EURY|nr:hypothetical protein [Natrinema salaciae]SER73889.1 hypothetical protein SAMN04489841_4462 [Natrinema salaciae]
MLDDLLLVPFELGVDWLIDRNDDRTPVQRICLFVGVVFVLLGIALAAVSGLWYGLAVGIVGLALLLYGA